MVSACRVTKAHCRKSNGKKSSRPCKTDGGLDGTRIRGYVSPKANRTECQKLILVQAQARAKLAQKNYKKMSEARKMSSARKITAALRKYSKSKSGSPSASKVTAARKTVSAGKITAALRKYSKRRKSEKAKAEAKRMRELKKLM